MRRLVKLAFLILFSVGYVGSALAMSPFVVKNIKVDGLSRVTLSTFKTYLPIKVGDRVTSATAALAIEQLYKTNFFSDVKLYRSGNTLVIKVSERRTIGSLTISGNSSIKTPQLLGALRKAGFVEGQPLDDSVLTGIQQALIQQYYQLAHYAVAVHIKVVPQVRNRVAVEVKIYEGPVAKVREIRFVGNHAFSAHKLRGVMSLTTPTLWSWITGSDKYSRNKLDSDLDKLRNFYLDNGYFQVQVDATHVAMSPDKKRVRIFISITEGPVYTYGAISLSGNLLGQRAKIMKMINIKRHAVFSRKQVLAINNSISHLYGDKGYAFCDVNALPKVDNVTHQVSLNFVVKPGKRVYVGRISFIGNSKTADYVLRRAMRQMEGGLYSMSAVDESKRQLANLGYLQNIQSKVVPVAGHSDQVEVQYSMKEVSSATAGANIGYSDAEGFIYGGGINDQNILGTGKAVGIQLSNSEYSKNLSLSYLDPYFTVNGVSMGINAYAQRITPNKFNISNYSSDAYGGTMNFGVPVSDNSRLTFGYGYEYTHIHKSDYTPPQILSFLRKHGDIFNQFKIIAGWQYSYLDRLIFPTKGATAAINADVGLPIGSRSLTYYTISGSASWYHPVFKYFVAMAHAFAGYGNGYGKYSDGLPFFKNFFAGGIGSVRGFDINSLGPLDKYGDALGGNISLYGTVGLVFPNPFGNSVRTTAFVDAGNIYSKKFQFNTLRYSTGIQVEWRTPIMYAPLVFSFAVPLHKYKGDDTRVFQFSIGAGF